MEAGFIVFIHKNYFLDVVNFLQSFDDAILTWEAVPPRSSCSATQSSKTGEEKVASEKFY